jgi:hypothetical protein
MNPIPRRVPTATTAAANRAPRLRVGDEHEGNCPPGFCGISVVEVDQCFRGAYCVDRRGEASLKRQSISTRLHNATSQKTIIFIGLLVVVIGWYRAKRSMYCDHFLIYCAPPYEI